MSSGDVSDCSKEIILDDVSVIVHPDLRERGRGIPENRMVVRERLHDLGGMRHFKKINYVWYVVWNITTIERITLSRFRTWLASCPESRGQVVVFAHYNTIRCLTKIESLLSRMLNLALVFSCLRLLRSFLRIRYDG